MIQIISKGLAKGLSQWDVGRLVQVTGDATHVHFANQGDSKAVIMDIEEGQAKIPDYLLQSGKTLYAYAVLDGVTLESVSFPVKKKERPENYVYEDDRRNYIYELISDTQAAKEAAELAAQKATAIADHAAETANLAAQLAVETANQAAQAATEVAAQAAQSADESATSANAAADKAEEAADNANDAADKAVRAAGTFLVVGAAKGENIVLTDAAEQYLIGCRIFGKSTQNGVPTPDAPVDIESVESPTLFVNTQSMVVPYTLRGVPVTTGGNYIDANGQRWVCDEIDFDRGVYIQRTGKWVVDGSINPESLSVGTNGGTVLVYKYTNVMNGISTNRAPKLCDKLQSTTNVNPASYKDCKVGFWSFNTVMAQDIYLIFNVGEFATAEEVSTYLRANPITFIGILATPIETPLSEEAVAAYKALYTSRGTTTISNDAGAYMEIEYVMDAKKYIDSLIGTGGSSSGTILPATVE